MGLTSMAVTAIASATKYYIKESSRVEYFPIEAKKTVGIGILVFGQRRNRKSN